MHPGDCHLRLHLQTSAKRLDLRERLHGSNVTKPDGLRISIFNDGGKPCQARIIVKVPEGIHLESSKLNTTVSREGGIWTYSFDAEIPPGLKECSFDYTPSIPAGRMSEGVYRYNITISVLYHGERSLDEISTQWQVLEPE